MAAKDNLTSVQETLLSVVLAKKRYPLNYLLAHDVTTGAFHLKT
jgi:hypothetical protein